MTPPFLYTHRCNLFQFHNYLDTTTKTSLQASPHNKVFSLCRNLTQHNSHASYPYFFTVLRKLLIIFTSWRSTVLPLPSHSNRATVKPCNVRRLSTLTASVIYIFHAQSVKYEHMKTIGAFLPFPFAVQLQQSTAGPSVLLKLIKTRSFIPREARASLKRMCQKPSFGFLLDSFWSSCWH